MLKVKKQLASLSLSSRRKYYWVMTKLEQGTPYSEVSGHKLYMPKGKHIWISIRLNYRERVIFALDFKGKFKPQFVGSHDAYDKLVGPKCKKRLWSNFS